MFNRDRYNNSFAYIFQKPKKANNPQVKAKPKKKKVFQVQSP